QPAARAGLAALRRRARGGGPGPSRRPRPAGAHARRGRLPPAPQPRRAGDRPRAGRARARGRRRGRGVPVPDRIRFGGGMSAEATALARPGRWTAPRQVWAMARWELRRFASWRSAWLVLAAFAPVVIILVHATKDRHHRLEDETVVLSAILQIYYVRFGT